MKIISRTKGWLIGLTISDIWAPLAFWKWPSVSITSSILRLLGPFRFFFFFFFLVFPVIWFHVCALNADLAANFKTNHCNCACEFFPSNEIMLLSRAILCILIVDRFAPSFIQQPRNWIFFDPGENLDTIPVPVSKNPNELTRASINLLGNRISHNSNVRVYRRWFDSLSTFQSLLTFGRAWCSMIGCRSLPGEVRDEFQDVNSS